MHALPHGGDLSEAARRFPEALEAWLDLSTGINPFPYPLPPLPPWTTQRLPEPSALAGLAAVAAACFGARPDAVVPAPGTGALLPHVFGLRPRGRAHVVGPTYAEHARVAALVGHRVTTSPDAEAADILVVVNPNNPDGRFRPRGDLLALADRQGRAGGLLVVDEAFMEVAPSDESLAPHVGENGIVVLRSFGKFHGLAGVRLGFAVAAAGVALRLRALLGPWAVSGPAVAAGTAALADASWAAATRTHLARAADALDAVLTRGGCTVLGGTSLFRFVAAPEGTFERLGRAGILVRRFDALPGRLRVGLPPDDAGLVRLASALA